MDGEEMAETGLTQEQIDSMLDSEKASKGDAVKAVDTAVLADFEREAMGNLPSVLNAMTGAEYQLGSVEFVRVQADELPSLIGDDLVFSMAIDIGEPVTHAVVLESVFAKNVAATLTGGEASEDTAMSEMEMSAIKEVVSQVNGTYLSGLSTALNITASGETVSATNASDVATAIGDAAFLGTLTLSHGDQTSQVRHLIPAQLAELVATHVQSGATTPESSLDAPPAPAPEPAPAAAPATAGPASQPAAPAVTVPPSSSGNVVGPATEYSPATFGQFSPPTTSADVRNLDILLDVPLQVTVELGKTMIPIRQILEYGQGSLITLDKQAGEPIDLLVNGKYFAKGEVVVIDENFGVRITSILSQAERIAQLT
jgi:flagellar motor switch protein FliN/FliY